MVFDLETGADDYLPKPFDEEESFLIRNRIAQLSKSRNRAKEKYYVEIKPEEDLGDTEYQIEIEML